MDDELCKHDLDPRWCTACKESKAPRPKWEATGFKMEARFSSPCEADWCGEWIEAGETIIQEQAVNRLSGRTETRFVCSDHE